MNRQMGESRPRLAGKVAVITGGTKGGSLACVPPTRRNDLEEVNDASPQDTQTRSRPITGQNGPSDSALAASSGGQLSPPSR